MNLSDQRHHSRVYHSDEYDADKSAPVSLTRALDRDFQPVEIGRTPWPSKEDLAALTAAAHAEGYETGRQEALTKAQQQRTSNAHALRRLLDGLTRPYDDLNDELARELATLAIDIGAALLRRELKCDPDRVIEIVRAAIASLPSGSREITITLHPEDLTICQELLQEQDLTVALEADPAIERGGCIVAAQAAVVDATIGQRLSNLVETLLDQPAALQTDVAD